MYTNEPYIPDLAAGFAPGFGVIHATQLVASALFDRRQMSQFQLPAARLNISPKPLCDFGAATM